MEIVRKEDDPLWVAQQFMRQQQEIGKAQSTADAALHVAEKGNYAQSAHEVLCATRYTNIEKNLDDVTNKFTMLFGKVDRLTTLVYTGVGIWVGIPVISGAIFGVVKLVEALKGG